MGSLLRVQEDAQVVGLYREPLEFLDSVSDVKHPLDRDELVPRPIVYPSAECVAAPGTV